MPGNKVQEALPISVRNFAFVAYSKSVMSASSLSVRQERPFNKTLCPSEGGQNFVELRELGASKASIKLLEFTDAKKQKLETGALRRLWNMKLFSLLLTNCFMVWYPRVIGNGSPLAFS
jgi:hypothetical protein